MKKQTDSNALKRSLVTSPEVLRIAHVISTGLRWIKASPVRQHLPQSLASYYVTGGIQVLSCVALSLMRKHISFLFPDATGDNALIVLGALQLRKFPTEKKLVQLVASYVSSVLSR